MQAPQTYRLALYSIKMVATRLSTAVTRLIVSSSILLTSFLIILYHTLRDKSMFFIKVCIVLHIVGVV